MKAQLKRYYRDPALSVEFDCAGCEFELRVFGRFVACELARSWTGKRRCKQYQRETPKGVSE